VGIDRDPTGDNGQRDEVSAKERGVRLVLEPVHLSFSETV
jgi:hypothetical protein